MVRERVRLRFSKKGTLRFIGHRDLLNTMGRLLRRSRLPVAMTEGFHPKQKVSYVSALALGMASDDEVMEVVFSDELSADDILDAWRIPGTGEPGGLLSVGSHSVGHD